MCGAAACLLLALTSAAASACTPPPAASYVIRHETYGEIGSHKVRFACAGADLLVDAEVSIRVSLAGIALYERQASYHETWLGDQLIAFKSSFDDNGQPYQVSARKDGREVVIEGAAGRIEAPASVVSNHPWNVAVVERPLLFDTREGRLQRVQVQPEGRDTLEIAGRPVAAERYLVAGDLERELWYDPAGRWLQSRLELDGAAVTVTWDGR